MSNTLLADSTIFARRNLEHIRQVPEKLTNVTIPNRVTTIGWEAFSSCTGLTSITVLDSIIRIGDGAFYQCTGLKNVALGSSVISIGDGAFSYCTNLTSVAIPDRVASIGGWAFHFCGSLTSVTIDKAVSYIGDWAFSYCSGLTAVYFLGDAPSAGSDVFLGTEVTIYYLPGTTGWGTTFGGRPTALWVVPQPVILTTAPNFGIQNNAFGFVISWATNASVVVEACSNFANAFWSPVSTNTLAGGSSYFIDTGWTNYPTRFYRLRSP
jgi:hypothetical protein